MKACVNLRSGIKSFIKYKVNDMKIAVAGTGYVGLSIAVLLAQHNTVKTVDIIPEKVEWINNNW